MHNKPITMKKLNFHKGFTLIELMVGITVSLIVLAGVTSVFVGTVKSSGDTLKASKLNQDMQAIMNIMVADIRRAGYWDSAGIGATIPNPFTDSGGDINTATAGCILYSYDKSAGNTTNGALNSQEYYGFKLNNGNVMMRRSGANVTDCTNGAWNNLNDDLIETINDLSFTSSFKCVNTVTGDTDSNNNCNTLLANPDTEAGHTLVETRRINISMTGNLTSDPDVTKQIRASVRVRNDRIFIAP